MADQPAGVIGGELLARKAETKELGAGMLPERVKAFIDGEFEVAAEAYEGITARVTQEAKSEANDFFRQWVERSDI